MKKTGRAIRCIKVCRFQPNARLQSDMLDGVQGLGASDCKRGLPSDPAKV
jgi:hypothetical protein